MSAFSVVPYSPSWPAEFSATSAALREIFAAVPGTVIQHIGSTSVPGLCAKPIIDILLGAPSLQAIESQIDALATAGFRYVFEDEAELPERRYFVRAAGTRLRVNLHAVEHASQFWYHHIAFRDALRCSPNLAGEYATLKLHLAQVHAQDRPAYTAAKAPFIEQVLAGNHGAA